MVKKENSLMQKIAAKGILLAITEEGFEFEDEKSGEVDYVTFDELKAFVGDSVAFSIGYKKPNKEKEE